MDVRFRAADSAADSLLSMGARLTWRLHWDTGAAHGPRLPTHRDLMGNLPCDVGGYCGPWINRSGLRVQGEHFDSSRSRYSAPTLADTNGR